MTIFNNKSNCFFIDLNKLNTTKITKEFYWIEADLKKNNLQLIINNNVNLDKPIYLVNNNNCNFNISIYINKNSKLTIIEHKNNQNNITDLNCLECSEVDYYLIQEEDSSKINIQQYANSKLTIKLLSNKLKNNRLKLVVNFKANDAELDLNVLQNITQKTSNNIELLINHLTANNSSSITTRTMADDHSCANLIGKIIVSKEAQNTFADLQSKGLILNKHASIINCPELDIYNNNVICTHGSSIGHLELDILFYMQSRGICLKEAKQMLINAFIEPIIKKINYPEIINYVYTHCTSKEANL